MSYVSDLVDSLLTKMTEDEIRALASAPPPDGFVNLASAPIIAELDYRKLMRERKSRLPWWRRIFA